MSSRVKLYSSNFGSRLAAFQDFMGNPVLTFNELMKLLKKPDVMFIEGLPLPPLGRDNVLVNPHLFPVVAYFLSVVCNIWQCLRMLNPYRSVVEAAETTGDSGSDLEVDFRGDRRLISV